MQHSDMLGTGPCFFRGEEEGVGSRGSAIARALWKETLL